MIGGDTAADRTIISGNGEYGINVVNSASVAIKGIYIGTNIDGTAALPNGYSGIPYRREFNRQYNQQYGRKAQYHQR